MKPRRRPEDVTREQLEEHGDGVCHYDLNCPCCTLLNHQMIDGIRTMFGAEPLYGPLGVRATNERRFADAYGVVASVG